MIHYRIKLLLFLLPGSILFPGCISSKKYHELGRRMNFSEEQRQKCESTLRTATVSLDSLTDTQQQTSRELSQARQALTDSKKQYQSLLRDYQNLQDNVISESEKLRKAQQKQAAELAAKDSLLQKLTRQFATLQVQAQQAEQQQQQSGARFDTLKNQLDRALYSFEGSELKIYREENKLVLAFAESLLFKPDHDQLDENGSVVLTSFARALAGQKGVKVAIESYTDAVPLMRENNRDSWYLALLRTGAVARFLSAEGIPASSLAPAIHINTDNSRQESTFKAYRLEIAITLL